MVNGVSMGWRVENVGQENRLLGVHCIEHVAIAVGEHGLVATRCQGGEWSTRSDITSENLNAIGGSATQLVAVGGNLDVGGRSLIVTRAGDVWRKARSPIQDVLLAVTPMGERFFAAGYNGGTIACAAGRWSQLDAAHFQHIFGLHGSGGRLFAVGLSGSVLELVEGTWSPHDSVTDEHLRDVHVWPDGTAVAVGLHGTIIAFDGTAWRQQDSSTSEHLEAIWGDRRGACAVGWNGIIVEREATRWQTRDSGTSVDLHAVSGSDHVLVAVGAQGTGCVKRRLPTSP